MREFALNSREFYEAVSPAPEAHVWGGGLPREPRWARAAGMVSVSADDDEAMGRSVREWLGHVEAGRLG